MSFLVNKTVNLVHVVRAFSSDRKDVGYFQIVLNRHVVSLYLALHPDQQHPAAESSAGEDVWSHGWKRCGCFVSSASFPSSHSNIFIISASYTPMIRLMHVCFLRMHLSCVRKPARSWKTCRLSSTTSWMISAGSSPSGRDSAQRFSALHPDKTKYRLQQTSPLLLKLSAAHRGEREADGRHPGSGEGNLECGERQQRSAGCRQRPAAHHGVPGQQVRQRSALLCSQEAQCLSLLTLCVWMQFPGLLRSLLWSLTPVCGWLKGHFPKYLKDREH